jgi:hypothetical protein
MTRVYKSALPYLKEKEKMLIGTFVLKCNINF